VTYGGESSRRTVEILLHSAQPNHEFVSQLAEALRSADWHVLEQGQAWGEECASGIWLEDGDGGPTGSRHTRQVLANALASAGISTHMVDAPPSSGALRITVGARDG